MKRIKLGKINWLIVMISLVSVLTFLPSISTAEESVIEVTSTQEDISYSMVSLFPDEVFRDLVAKHLQELSIPVVPTGSVKQSELNKLTQISSVYRQKIETLEGIQTLENLERINLNNTQIKTLDPLEHLNKLSSIKITSSEISDVSALVEIAKNEAKIFSVNLAYNQVTDFSFIPEIDAILSSKNKWGWGQALTLDNQSVSTTFDQRVTELPVTVPMPTIILHDGSLLNYETTTQGHFEKGNFVLEKLHPEKKYFSTHVEKTYNSQVSYGISTHVDVPNNYLFPKGIKQEFTINVNEPFDFNSPFLKAETEENWGFLWGNSYQVNREKLDCDKPGVYELDYILYKMSKYNSGLEGIPFKVKVTVLPVTYKVDFKLGSWWEDSYKVIETNKDMTVTPPQEIPKKEGYIFEGWAYDSYEQSALVDFTQTIRNDSTFYAKWKKDKPQGDYIKDGRYVTVVKKGSGSWSNFDWQPRESGDTLFEKTYQAKGRYEHRNGKTYYSIYDDKGNWKGYIDAADTKVAAGKQGVYLSDGRYVTVVKKGYNTWSNFSWNQKLSNNQILNKTYQAKGRYVHANGSTYYSIYDDKGNWKGYLSAGAVKVGNGKQGAYIADNKKVSVLKKNYNSWANFSWKKKYPGTYFTDTSYEARGKYYHMNGSVYYSLYNVNGLWQGYISQQALRFY